MAKTDKLEIRMKFNGKKVILGEEGETARPTFKKMMELFSIEEGEDEILLG